MAKANPFRFSTKYQDDETDLLYYGYRYYNASTGRWNSRDAIGEWAGKNLYCFVRNGPQSFHDILGRISSKTTGFKWQDGTPLEVTASLDPSNPDEPCLGGFLKFNVHVEANTPPDRSYMGQSHFFFDSTEVQYTDYGEGRQGWAKFDVPYTKALPGCPVGKQSGVDVFKGVQAYGNDIEGGLSITFKWTYTCDECCNTRKPLAVSFDFSPFGSLEWPKGP